MVNNNKTLNVKNKTYIRLWRYHSIRRSKNFGQGDTTNISFDDTINELLDKSEVKE